MAQVLPITQPTTKAARLQSLDALRGFDMFWIISGEGIFHGLADAIKETYALTRNTENWQIAIDERLGFWERLLVQISNQLHHSPWNGFTFYDLIFPLFIFIAGVSMPFSFGSKLKEGGAWDKSAVYKALVRRTVLLILLGMVVNGALQLKGYHATRFASVLGRIGLSCFFATLIYLNASFRWRIAWVLGILMGYWVFLVSIPVPGAPEATLTPERNWVAYLDRMFLPGKLHRTVYDPEGLLSTLPAVVSCLLGVFAGEWLRKSEQELSGTKKAIGLLGAGLLLLGIGEVWSFAFPVNKILWTSSFVCVAGGWSVVLLAIFYFVIDVKKIQVWSVPFVWIGMNSILIYIAAHGMVNFLSSAEFLFGGLVKKLPEIWQAAFLWIGVCLIQLGLLYFLWKKKIFLKL
ncbi:MAG: DUF5009 domain-containing protein [Chitinophagaceae bacterium]|nr:DUF5009 domain-containing protein [Chitinophagaceae bacterium]